MDSLLIQEGSFPSSLIWALITSASLTDRIAQSLHCHGRISSFISHCVEEHKAHGPNSEGSSRPRINGRLIAEEAELSPRSPAEQIGEGEEGESGFHT